MSPARSHEDLANLVKKVAALPNERDWAERKLNRAEPREIGEYISALANSAALAGKPFGYLVWGVTEDTREIAGTTFSPASAKKGNEDLENWLTRLLSPQVSFNFYPVEVDGRQVVLLEIPRAVRHPVQFEGQAFIRIGSYTKKLKDFPETERKLWQALDETPFEKVVAIEGVGETEAISLLDHPAYFSLLSLPVPDSPTAIISALLADGLLERRDSGNLNITNLGAVLLARKIREFPTISRKAVRVIVYKGADRVETIREQLATRAYGSGFAALVAFIRGLLPSVEVIQGALRRTVPTYPDLAVRELVANALVHQDFHVTGAGPTIEIFSDRMEITNPGLPLVAPDRFLDSPPRSRNEALAALMRRFGICEERGSGVDKVIQTTEAYQLPAPLFEVAEGFTRAVLFAPRALSKMEKADRIRACYWHASLLYVNRQFMTNSTLRARFGIEPRNKATASRLIREAVKAGVIVPDDEDAAPKLMRYRPWWARPAAS